MEETFEQKVIRNVQGNFAVYKTSEVVGSKSNIPNLEWMESDEVDKFFAFARNLGAKVIYITEADEEDEEGNTKNTIIQVGFLNQSIMHHINLIEEEDEDEDGEEEDEDEYEDEDDIQTEEPQPAVPQNPPQSVPQQQFGQAETRTQNTVDSQPQQQQQTNQVPQQQNQNNGFIGGNNF